MQMNVFISARNLNLYLDKRDIFLPNMHNSNSCIHKTIKYKSKHHANTLESLTLDHNKHKGLIYYKSHLISGKDDLVNTC